MVFTAWMRQARQNRRCHLTWLQNPELIGGHPYYVFPALHQILVMVDHDGDENYQPMLIPVTEATLTSLWRPTRKLSGFCTECDPAQNCLFFDGLAQGSVNVGYRETL
jgi:hypothetical protein